MNLLTWHGTIVCLDGGGGLMQRALPLTEDAPRPLVIDGKMLPSPIRGAPPRPASHMELGQITIAPIGAGRCVTIKREGRYLCAEAAQPVMVFDHGGSPQWESFLPISEEEVGCLQHILTNRWILAGSRQLLGRTAIRVGSLYRLHVGDTVIDLSAEVPLAKAASARKPRRISLPYPGGTIELVLASPDGSPLLSISRWRWGGRRLAEILALAAHRHILEREPEQAELDRDARLLRARGGAAGLSELLDSLQRGVERAREGGPRESVDRSDEAGATMFAWAAREVAPWQLHPVSVAQAADGFAKLNTSRKWAAVFRFAGGEVFIADKPDGVRDQGYWSRAEDYRTFFRAVASLLPPDFETTICMTMDDLVHEDPAVPVFSFQKRRGARSLLMPDIDFLIQRFFEGAGTTDPYQYHDKNATAVFSGSTTGGWISTEVARNLSLPRLRAAGYFVGNARVDFRLPAIGQATTEEAHALLSAQPFCQKARLPWSEQFKSRFVISIDGNGATCSRVAVALRSNSVLLKYESEHVLYYFGGLQPWLHYVPVSADSDVEKIMDMEARDPSRFEQMAASGKLFGGTFLTREATQQYAAILLQLYAASFSAN
jgi:hypothetical protein